MEVTFSDLLKSGGTKLHWMHGQFTASKKNPSYTIIECYDWIYGLKFSDICYSDEIHEKSKNIVLQK